MVKQALLSRAARDLGSHQVIHDSKGAQERFPRARPRRRVSRHDVEWKDVEPALDRPARPWDRPMPRPMGKGRTHGRGRKRRRR